MKKREGERGRGGNGSERGAGEKDGCSKGEREGE